MLCTLFGEGRALSAHTRAAVRVNAQAGTALHCTLHTSGRKHRPNRFVPKDMSESTAVTIAWLCGLIPCFAVGEPDLSPAHIGTVTGLTDPTSAPGLQPFPERRSRAAACSNGQRQESNRKR